MIKRLFILCLLAGPGIAQESDADYLTAFLEDSLSDAGREVKITGFAGALSSQATFQSMTIADDSGVWLTVTGVTLDWSQSSLLSGELVVNELSAEKVTMTRPPKPSVSSLPSPEAVGFALPELPVSISVSKVEIGAIKLDPRVLGQPVEGRLEASFSLAAGAGQAKVSLVRADQGPDGRITLDAAFDNLTRHLNLTLAVSEGDGGLVATALGLPGVPSTDFLISGAGTLDAFLAELRLTTDGERRLEGQVTVSGGAKDESRLSADLSGNLAPLFLPDYAAFLGPRLDLSLTARRSATGAVYVDNLVLSATALSITGKAVFAADGMPESVALKGLVASPNGTALLLPFSGPPTRIDHASFEVSTTRETALEWRATAEVTGLDRPDLAAALLLLSGSGRIGRTDGGRSFGGTVRVSAADLAPTDPSLAKLIGPTLTAGFKFHFLEGRPDLRLSQLHLSTEGMSGTGDLGIEGLDQAFLTSGRLSLAVDDLSRFSDIAGLSLSGQGELLLEGAASQLSGFVDGTIAARTKNLRIGIPQIDGLLAGDSSAVLSLRRDETGLEVRQLDLVSDTAGAAFSGTMDSTAVNVTGSLQLLDMTAVDPAYSGTANLTLSMEGASNAPDVSISGSTNGLSFGNDLIDSLLAGNTDLAADFSLGQTTVSLDSLTLKTRQLGLSVTGELIEGRQRLTIEGTLADLSLLAPQLSGALILTGDLVDKGDAILVDMLAQGPGQMSATIGGKLDRNMETADLSVQGTVNAGLANLFVAPKLIEGQARFDLRLAGPLRLDSITGQINLSKGRLSDPGLGFSLDGILAQADLKSGKAKVIASAGLTTGGKLAIEGEAYLSSPYRASLDIALDAVRFFDPKLYETVLGGRLSFNGPLLGGAMVSGDLTLSETELRVPEAGIDAAGILYEISHQNEPADVRATRIRADLINQDGTSRPASDGQFKLDLGLSAPSRIFLRGRGIDAELGGELRLGGTTGNVVPSGKFGLIRGRLDILGKRLTLEKADLELAGSFVPRIALSASVESDGITSTVTIDGPADDPEVEFASVPDLPQEEVLARLLFGRSLSSISALQAAQLAQAVAVLAGRGGEGIIGKLRKSFGLDDLDLATAEDGSAALKAGKYISENLYTEVEVDQAGTSRINLNLDLGAGVTVKGRVGADGDTGVGIFVEKDY